jgi:hypothetical protein
MAEFDTYDDSRSTLDQLYGSSVSARRGTA